MVEGFLVMRFEGLDGRGGIVMESELRYSILKQFKKFFSPSMKIKIKLS